MILIILPHTHIDIHRLKLKYNELVYHISQDFTYNDFPNVYVYIYKVSTYGKLLEFMNYMLLGNLEILNVYMYLYSGNILIRLQLFPIVIVIPLYSVIKYVVP